jgi:nucleoside-diphosphate-sugar epimerase
MRVLVTGATGYIGAHFVKAMAERGHEVVGTDVRTDQNDISKYTSDFCASSRKNKSQFVDE